jgi:hypothetical protein
MEKEFMNDWLFHYNPYTKIWSAFHRQDMVKYFNGEKTSTIIQSNKQSTLVEIITKSEGDLKKIKKFINE